MGRRDRVGLAGLRRQGEPELRQCLSEAPVFGLAAGNLTVQDVPHF